MLLLNGQEVGEPGAQAEGYELDDGRTTVFDYWATALPVSKAVSEEHWS